MFFLKIRPETKLLIEDIKNNPDDWQSDGYRYTNIHTQSVIWIGNDSWGLELNGACVFNYKERRALWKVIKKNLKYMRMKYEEDLLRNAIKKKFEKKKWSFKKEAQKKAVK